MSVCPVYYINTGCWITAHDPETGEEIWRTNTVPKIGEPGGETWGDVPNERRGLCVDAVELDPELDLIYVGCRPYPGVKFSEIPAVEMSCIRTRPLRLTLTPGIMVFQYPGELGSDHPLTHIVESEFIPNTGY